MSIYTFLGEQFVAGKSLMAGDIDHIFRGGLADNFCKLAPYGPAVSDAAKADAEAAKEQFLKNQLVIYNGELKDNKGGEILAAGDKYEQQNIELEKMDWLIEGVQGSVGG